MTIIVLQKSEYAEYDRRRQDRLLLGKIFFRNNGANGCRVPVGSRGCRSHSSTSTGCACSHGGEVFILRKRDIDRNGGRVLYGLSDSWGDGIRHDGSRARNVSTRGSPNANARSDDRFSPTQPMDTRCHIHIVSLNRLKGLKQ